MSAKPLLLWIIYTTSFSSFHGDSFFGLKLLQLCSEVCGLVTITKTVFGQLDSNVCCLLQKDPFQCCEHHEQFLSPSLC